MTRPLFILIGSLVSAVLGFVPTGVVASCWAASAVGARLRGEDERPASASALRWLGVTAVIGVLFEVPVVVVALAG